MDDMVSYLQEQGIGTTIQKGSLPESPDTCVGLRETGGFPSQHTMAPATNYAPFPSTGLLDSFTRANEDPLGNGTWANFRPSLQGLRLVSLTARVNSSSFGSSYWSAAQFGPDCEFYATVVTRPDEGNVVNLYLRLSGAGTELYSGYLAQFKRSALGLRCAIYSVTNGNPAVTIVAETEVGSWSDGERIGCSIDGSRIRLWKGPASGASSLLLSAVNTLYPSAGFCALTVGGLAAQQAVLDDVGGGTSVRIAARVVIEEPTVQVLTRAAAYDTAEVLIRQIKTVLDGLRQQTINGVQYHWITALQPPFLLERDENKRFVLCFNVHIKRQTVL